MWYRALKTLWITHPALVFYIGNLTTTSSIHGQASWMCNCRSFKEVVRGFFTKFFFGFCLAHSFRKLLRASSYDNPLYSGDGEKWTRWLLTFLLLLGGSLMKSPKRFEVKKNHAATQQLYNPTKWAKMGKYLSIVLQQLC